MAKRFGAYEILYELKTGGMGAVLLGRRRGPGAFEQLVAIKTILPAHAKTEAVRAMFLDEAAILARLNHPAIATVHDFGEDGGTLYMVMEYVAGIAFRDVIERGIPASIAARAVVEACRGVHAAHELHDLGGHLLGVVHRDISPDNLMLGFDGHVKVIDFGIALVKNRQAPVTEFGTVKGKPPYMSPEQVKNEAIDRRSDVFSLAVVLWEMLTGRGLFEGDSIYAIARAVEHQEIKPPSHVLGAPLPLGLDAVVMNALDRDLARRTPSAAAFAEQLEDVIQSAGDETLEAWAARMLDEPRTAHRAWLASVAAGKDAPRPLGRATGMVTALAPQLGKAATMLAPVALAVPPATGGMTGGVLAPVAPGASAGENAHAPEPHMSTHLAPLTEDELAAAELAPRRSLALPIVLGLLVLALVGGGIALLGRPPDRGMQPRPGIDAGIDAGIVDPRDAALRDAVVVVPPASDAAVMDAAAPDDAGIPIEVPVEVPIDVPIDVPVDAGRRHTVRPLDAGHRAGHDAQTAAPAGAETIPQGFGKLIAKHTGEIYLNVLIDGSMFGPTPVIGEPIPTGTHVIDLVDVATHKIVVHRTVTVHPGETILVTP
ncbi:MAG TPA: protein kinase [Kofleriaceae bacterium]|nr:protein kinase [Kofleriaceae bacterium]